MRKFNYFTGQNEGRRRSKKKNTIHNQRLAQAFRTRGEKHNVGYKAVIDKFGDV